MNASESDNTEFSNPRKPICLETYRVCSINLKSKLES
jgi:hypothetical protein